MLSMDFPSFELKKIPVTDEIIKAIGIEPVEVYMGADTFCVLENEEQVKSIIPNQELVRNIDGV